MDHHYESLTGFKVGEIVRVEEELEVFWKGEIFKIHTGGSMATVKDVNPNSIGFNDLFVVYVRQLAKWDPADDVNI